MAFPVPLQVPPPPILTGTAGTPVNVVTNFNKLERIPHWLIFVYHVTFDPPVDNKQMRIALLYYHSDLLGPTRAFDGTVLFTPRKLPLDVTEVCSVRKLDEVEIKVKLELVSELQPNDPSCIQIWNIIFKRVLTSLNMQQIGKNYYSMDRAVNIPKHRLQVVPGFMTSILAFEVGLLLNLDISHKILSMSNVLEMMYQMYERGDVSSFHDEIIQKFCGSIVLTRYNNRTYRVDDIAWDSRPTDTFRLTNGTEITFAEYYKKNYQLTISNEQQPLLVSRPKKKDFQRGQTSCIMLIPEFCYLTGLSQAVRKDFMVMKDIAAHTRVFPEARVNTLQRFIQEVQRCGAQEMGSWGLILKPNPYSPPARLLPKEHVFAQNHQTLSVNKDQEWGHECRRTNLVRPMALYSWILMFSRANAQLSHDFLRVLRKVGHPLGLRINDPLIYELPGDRNDCYIKALRENIKPVTQVVMCVVPTDRKDRYDAIKKFCCLECPVPTQVVVGRTISRKQNLMSVATKIALQLMCKVGGELWTVDIPLSRLMVIGIDTYHDSAKKGCSVAGIVCSLNSRHTRYFSKVCFQQANQEISDSLTVPIAGALEKYRQVNNFLPDVVIAYRDGVDDGKLPLVCEHEVNQIRRILSTYHIGRLDVVVVKKGSNVRFFAKEGPRIGNPLPGTVIDSEVTKHNWCDFYLVSQSVRQGTVMPTHYNVVYSTSGLKADHIQRLTYKMCHIYYNWPGTIRVPAPCQYAHKLAFLVGQSIHKQPSGQLSDLLYYL